MFWKLGSQKRSPFGFVPRRTPFFVGFLLFAVIGLGGLVVVRLAVGNPSPVAPIVTPATNPDAPVDYLSDSNVASADVVRRATIQAAAQLHKEVAACQRLQKGADSCIRVAAQHLQMEALNNAMLIRVVTDALLPNSKCGQWVLQYQSMFSQFGSIARDLQDQILYNPTSWRSVAKIVLRAGREASAASTSRQWGTVCGATAATEQSPSYRL